MKFYDRPVVTVAREMIGCVLVRGDCAGVIVETEAYHHTEPACHAYVGLTARTSTLFGPPGLAYVYRSYGIHALINAVCEGPEVGAAGPHPRPRTDRRPGVDGPAPRAAGGRPASAVLGGRGKLTQALGIGLDDNRSDLTVGPVFILPRPDAGTPAPISASPRIGITKGVELPWRFCLTGSRFLSVPVPKSGPGSAGVADPEGPATTRRASQRSRDLR